MKKLYLAGPYTGTDTEIKWHIIKAIDAAIVLRKKGYNVLLPHANFVYCDDLEQTKDGRKILIHMCCEWIDACDIFCLMPGWKHSRGCRNEFAYAQKAGKEIMYLTG